MSRKHGILKSKQTITGRWSGVLETVGKNIRANKTQNQVIRENLRLQTYILNDMKQYGMDTCKDRKTTGGRNKCWSGWHREVERESVRWRASHRKGWEGTGRIEKNGDWEPENVNDANKPLRAQYVNSIWA
jgi:hypothetical protein